MPHSEPATEHHRKPRTPRWAPLLLIGSAMPLAGCGSDTPPPLTGNLTDAHGAHAGSFRGPDNGAAADAVGNSQGNTQ